jgi:hypothetical protein
MAVHGKLTTEWQFVGVLVIVTKAGPDQVNSLSGPRNRAKASLCWSSTPDLSRGSSRR